jgi:hypothetical protein
VQVLAATWPVSNGALVAELDPDGGSIALRHEIPAEPGLTTLAAAGRRGLAPDVVARHSRRLSDGTPVLLGPVAPDRAASALSVLGARLAFALDAVPGIDVLADCGRISNRSAALDVVRAARYVVVVVTPTVEGVAQVQSRLSSLDLAPGRLAVMTIGQRPYRPGDVGDVLEIPVLGSLADDRRAALDLVAGRPVRRSELWRSAATLSAGLLARLTRLEPSPTTPPGDGVAVAMHAPSANPDSGGEPWP